MSESVYVCNVMQCNVCVYVCMCVCVLTGSALGAVRCIISKIYKGGSSKRGSDRDASDRSLSFWLADFASNAGNAS